MGIHEIRMPHGVAHMKTFKAYTDGDVAIVIDPEEHEAYRWFYKSDILQEEDIIWGLPTQLLDFKLIESLETDPTLLDGSKATLLKV